MDLTQKDNLKPEEAEELVKALMKVIDDHLDLKRWKFHLTFTKHIKTSNIKLIYDSEWCRIKFSFSRQRTPSHDELTVDYGRMHAPNEEPYMRLHDSEPCRCWHNIVPVIYFLDGLTAFHAVQRMKIQMQSPTVIETFIHSPMGEALRSEYPPKFQVIMHSLLWQQYGARLFEIFDLRQPHLWEEYKKFIAEYYKLLGLKANYGPPYENIC